ncbi:MAG: hypothetical protein K2N71_03790 [Oscillospiraceae bacterium]|nr:hypothetical protein [Oscillospiraceae bacterium]
MEQLLKEFFFSDACEVNNRRTPSKEKADALKKQDMLLKKLKEHFSEEDHSLFEEYANTRLIVDGEDQYIAFICGIKITLQALTELICETYIR